MICIITLILFVQIGQNSLTQLTSSDVSTQTIDTNSKLEFGFGAFYSYSPIPYYITKYGSDNQNYLFLGAIIHKQTNKIKLIHYCDISESQKKIIHKFKLATGELFQYEISNPQVYEGQWYFYYIKYSTISQTGTIQISDVSKMNNQIFHFNGLIDQSEYIIQYTGVFEDDTNTKYSYFTGLIYNITQFPDYIVAETNLLQDASLAQYTCYQDYNAQNLFLKYTESTIQQYFVNQGCSDYAIESWIKLINLPIYSYWEAEIFQVAHNKFEDYFAHAGGNAFKFKYVYNNEKINLNIQTYSYSFPTIFLTQALIDADTVQHTFEDIKIDLLKWHFFRFKKVSTTTQFQIYYPENDLTLLHDFGKLYQFTRPFFIYYLGRNPQNDLSYGLELQNLTIYNSYYDTSFTLKCFSSCKTCSGPTFSDCRSCYEGSFRVLKDNKCVCQLGYIELYDDICYYPPSFDFNISSVKLEIAKEGYETQTPILKCQFGYFPYDNQCLKCPQPLTDQFIGCYECVGQFYDQFFYEGFVCRSSLIKVGQSFINTPANQIKYRYSLGDLIVMVESSICQMTKTDCFRGIHSTEDDQGQYCRTIDYQLNEDDGLCYLIKPVIYENIECGQFCESCDSNSLKCFRCLDPQKYFISSDGYNCELCTIPNCKYCTLEDQDNKKFEIYSLNFSPVNRNKDSLFVVCARCQDQFIFNYNTLACEAASPISNCELYYKDPKQQTKCILSQSIQYSYTISKCQNYIPHCQVCTISQYTLEPICLQCELYYVEQGSQICNPCSQNYPCFKDDFARHDKWKLEIQPYYYNLHPFSDVIWDKYSHYFNSIQMDICNLIDIYQNYCTQCQSDDYGTPKHSLNLGNCKTCPYLCQACDDLSPSEILAINPQFSSTYTDLNYMLTKCYQKSSESENIYIDSNMRSLLCSDNQPCKVVGTQERLYPNCFRLMMVLSLRSIGQFSSSINTKALLERGVSNFKFEWTLNSPTTCQLSARIESILQNLIVSLKETEFILKGDTQNDYNYITASFLIQEFTYVCLRNFVILDNSMDKLRILHTTFYLDIDLVNIMYKDWTYNNPIITQNVRNIRLINNTFDNIKFIGESIITFTQEYQLIESITIENIMFINCEFSDSNMIDLKAKQVDYRIKIKIENIKLIDCIFRNFTFFNLIIEQGDVIINNIEFRNITTYEFNFIYTTVKNLSTFNNLLIQSSKINQQSVIIKSNYIQLKELIVRENVFEESSLYTMINDSSIDLIFDQINFINNRIEGIQPLMELTNLNNKITMLNIQIENLTCLYHEFNYYPLFQFQANILEINNLHILQPKTKQKLLFNVHNTNLVNLNNINIQNKDSIDKTLTTTYECFSQDDTQGIFTLMDNCEIDISSISIQNIQAINNALFTIIFSDNYKYENQRIAIKDVSISDTILVKTKQNIQISLFYITTSQNLMFSLTDSNFTKIWMHHYYTDNVICSTLLTIVAPYSSVNFYNLQLNQILATNTSNSIFQLDCRTINMSNIQASEINYFKYFNFKSFIQNNLQIINAIYMEDLNFIFSIESLGGLSNCQAENMYFDNLTVTFTQSHSGGLYYIKTKSNGIISIQNSRFTNIQGDLLASDSSGGLLYIDSSTSLLSLTICNIVTSETFSWQYGGLIYIKPSVQSSNVYLTNITLKNSFSSQGSILYGEFRYRSTAIIIINNLTISEQNLEQFILKLQIQNEQDIKDIILNNYLFDHSNCKTFAIKNSKFSNMKYVNFLNLQNVGTLILYDVKFTQIYFTKSSFLSVLNTQIKSSIILFDKLIIENSSYFTYNQSTYALNNIKCSQYIPQQYQQECSKDTIIPTNTLYYLDIYKFEIFNCNINTIISISDTQNYSQFFKVSIQENSVYFRGTNLFVKNVNISNQKGLINLEITEDHQNQIELLDSIFLNNDCGQYGCLSLITTDIIDELDNVVTNITQVQGSQNQSRLRRLEENFDYVNLYNLDFSNNKANYGTGILSININANITNCQFLNNIAKYAGGAIYIHQQSNNLILDNLFLSNNQAELGSDLFIKGNQDQIDLSSIQGISLNSNKSVSSKPVALTIKAINGIILNRINKQKGDIILDQVYIKPYKIYGSEETKYHLIYPSGQVIKNYTYFETQSQTYIPYNLSLQILAFNDKFEQVINLKGSSCNLYSKLSNSEGDFQPLPNLETVYYDTQTNSYNLDNYIFIFDPIIQNDLHLIIKVKCNSILYDNYELLFTVQTFNCQMGEYYYQSQCLVCDPEQSYYSLDPSKGKCDIKNDQTTLNIKSAMVQLKENYWRPKVQSSQIVYCSNNPKNCLGGWKVGDLSCKPGFIGALCEECDLWNINGYGRFGKTVDYNCGACEDFYFTYLKIVLLLLWIYLSVLITCQSFNSSNVDIQQQLTLHPVFYKILHSFSVDKTGIVLKMFTNFIQIISVIQSFHITLNLNLDFAFGLVGNPVKQITTLLQCQLSVYANFDIVYYQMVLMVCLVIFLIQLGLCLYMLLIFTRKTSFNSSNVWVLVIFIYLFTQSGLIFDLSSLLGYREIANEKWVKGAVYLKYDTFSHFIWILRVVLPIIGIFEFVIPGLIFFTLYHNRQKLFDFRFRKRFSYLVNEYKESAWFWEIIKIFQRTYIIANLNLYSDEMLVKSTQIFLAILIYLIFLYLFQPYSFRPLIDLEMKSTIVQLCSIILAATIYQTQLSENQIQYFYALILIFIVSIQMLIFIYEISRGYFEKLRRMIDNVIYRRLQDGQITLPRYLEEYFRQKQLRKTLLKMRFRKLKIHLRSQTRVITEAKSNYQSVFPKTILKSEYNYTDILISPKTGKQEDMILKNQVQN